jgi:dipeptidase E
MKTLILVSQYSKEIQNEILQLLPAPANFMKVAFVFTARKPKMKNNPARPHDDKNLMIEAGFIVEEYDLDDKDEEEVREDLMKFDIVYVAGGNTLYLMNAMHEVNFAQTIRELLDDGLIYIGESAGSIAAGPDIKPTIWLNDTNEIRLKDLTGLFLVPFGILPHFKGQLPESVGREVMKAPYDVKFLKDNQLLYVKGDKVTLVEAK